LFISSENAANTGMLDIKPEEAFTALNRLRYCKFSVRKVNDVMGYITLTETG